MANDIIPGVSVFVVFDGHGGNEISKFCTDHFVEFLKQTDGFVQKDYEQALLQTYLALDDAIANGEFDLEIE